MQTWKRLRILLVFLALIPSCRRGVDDTTCRAEASALGALLRKADRGTPLARGDFELVSRLDLPDLAPPPAPVVSLGRGQVMVSGRAVRGDGDLAGALSEERERAAMLYPGRPAGELVHLEIERTVTWREIAAVITAVHEAGYTRVGFLFAQPSRVAAPARSWADDELDRLTERAPGDRATELAKLASRIAEPCPQVLAAFSNVAPVDPDKKAQNLVDELERALPACHCKIDLPALRSVMFRLLSDPHPTSAVVKNLAPRGRSFVAAAAAPWDEVAKQLTAGDEPIWPGLR